MHFSQKRELVLFPITTLLPSLIVRFLFVISLSARAARTVFCSFFVRSLFVSLFRYYTPSPWERVGERIFSSSFLYLPVRLAPSFVRSFFVHCSSFLRSLFVLCSSFVRLLFVNYLSARVAHTICLSCYDCPCGSYCHSSLIWYFWHYWYYWY